MHLRACFPVALAFTITAFACTTTEYVVQGGNGATPLGEGGLGADDGGGLPATDASAPKTPKQTCEELISCVADVSPGQAGPLVTLYGDASNCWKGGPADADACGKACASELEKRSECSAGSLDGTYVALCTGTTRLRYLVEVVFNPRKGGSAIFKPLPLDKPEFHASDALMTQPTVTLRIESGAGAGKSTTPFDMPSAGIAVGVPNVRVESFEVTRLRGETGTLCSELTARIGAPMSTTLTGRCMYIANVAEGTPMPLRTDDQVHRCGE